MSHHTLSQVPIKKEKLNKIRKKINQN